MKNRITKAAAQTRKKVRNENNGSKSGQSIGSGDGQERRQTANSTEKLTSYNCELQPSAFQSTRMNELTRPSQLAETSHLPPSFNCNMQQRIFQSPDQSSESGQSIGSGDGQERRQTANSTKKIASYNCELQPSAFQSTRTNELTRPSQLAETSHVPPSFNCNMQQRIFLSPDQSSELAETSHLPPSFNCNMQQRIFQSPDQSSESGQSIGSGDGQERRQTANSTKKIASYNCELQPSAFQSTRTNELTRPSQLAETSHVPPSFNCNMQQRIFQSPDQSSESGQSIGSGDGQERRQTANSTKKIASYNCELQPSAFQSTRTNELTRPSQLAETSHVPPSFNCNMQQRIFLSPDQSSESGQSIGSGDGQERRQTANSTEKITSYNCELQPSAFQSTRMNELTRSSQIAETSHLPPSFNCNIQQRIFQSPDQSSQDTSNRGTTLSEASRKTTLESVQTGTTNENDAPKSRFSIHQGAFSLFPNHSEDTSSNKGTTLTEATRKTTLESVQTGTTKENAAPKSRFSIHRGAFSLFPNHSEDTSNRGTTLSEASRKTTLESVQTGTTKENAAPKSRFSIHRGAFSLFPNHSEDTSNRGTTLSEASRKTTLESVQTGTTNENDAPKSRFSIHQGAFSLFPNHSEDTSSNKGTSLTEASRKTTLESVQTGTTKENAAPKSRFNIHQGAFSLFPNHSENTSSNISSFFPKSARKVISEGSTSWRTSRRNPRITLSNRTLSPPHAGFLDHSSYFGATADLSRSNDNTFSTPVKHIVAAVSYELSPDMVVARPKIARNDPDSPSIIERGLRRSSRNRIHTLQHSLGQRPVYTRDKRGNYTLIGVTGGITKDRNLKKYGVSDPIQALNINHESKKRRQLEKKIKKELHLKAGFNAYLSETKNTKRISANTSVDSQFF